ncbi:YeeE/YedE family protein [Dyella acidisoli]|uniref:YeeE/YedE family protein n=1 Tax=Dyella acidisoli TaxID=1867834 RepID=UPI0024E13053|nr:YeeE/YedE family protein [Dyella acidisoli]
MQLWFLSVMGGVLIGLAAVLLMSALGRVAGISGIASSLVLGAKRGDRSWRWAFILGLLIAPLCLMPFVGNGGIGMPQVGWSAMAVAGLLVGFGTRLGSGCTSGHGVCGIARFSTRSLLATVVFMLFGIATVFVLRHVARGLL